MINNNYVLYDRYEFAAELGKGGMSTVYLAKDKMLGSYWAVKKVRNDGGKDVQAFKKEVELLSSLNHADIPRIVDKIECDGDFYVVMDFVDGVSLGKKVLAEGPQPEKNVVEWALMLCDVMEYLHTVKSNPIVYCDLKPDNIMLTKSGRIKLIDFGIARECIRGMLQSDVNIGTKGYAAPEQYKSMASLDERTDIYSFGASLAYVLTGITPGIPPEGVKSLRMQNPKLSEGIDYIVGKCTKDNPEKRYRNFSEIREDLQNIDKLTSSYRRKMRNRLLSFYVCLTASLLFLVPAVMGYSGVQEKKADKYQYYYQQASSAVKSNNYEKAAECYEKSIKYKPKSAEAYLLYFDCILPREKNDNYKALLKSAIDIMRNSYIENKNSDMYHKPELMYPVMKRCVETNDSSYAEYALDYIKLLNDKKFEADDLKYYQVIASNCAKSLSGQDFKKMGTALAELEKYTDNSKMTIDAKLENYYAIMILYSEYANYFDSSYEHILNLGEKSKTLIDNDSSADSMKFANIIPMYELTALALYNNAVCSSESVMQEENYKKSLEWFGYLDALNDDLSESLWLRKANAIMNLYLITQDTDYLDKSINEYNKMLKKYPESFSGRINVSMVYLDKALLTKDTDDYANASQSFQDVLSLKNKKKNLSSAELLQFGSLKRSYINAGIQEE